MDKEEFYNFIGLLPLYILIIVGLMFLSHMAFENWLINFSIPLIAILLFLWASFWNNKSLKSYERLLLKKTKE